MAEPHTEAEDLDQNLTASQTRNPTKVSLVSHSQASGDPWGVLDEGVDGYKLREQRHMTWGQGAEKEQRLGALWERTSFKQ